MLLTQAGMPLFLSSFVRLCYHLSVYSVDIDVTSEYH